MKKRLLAVLLCVLMTIALLPATALAAVGDTFTVQSLDSTPVDVTLKVLTDPDAATPGTVQVGNGTDKAIGGGITSVTLPEELVRPGTTERYRVTTVGGYAFADCSSLHNIALPEVQEIGPNAFNSCSALASVTIWNNTSAPGLGNTTVFENVSSDCTLYVPDSASGYDTALGWPSNQVRLWPVSGTVYNADATATANATVSVYGISTKTDVNGKYTVHVRPDEATPAAITAKIEGAGKSIISVSNVTGALSNQNIYFAKVAEPEFSPAGGTYTGEQSVSISAADGATIRYTTAGSEPTENSKSYSAPISVSSTTTLKAKAFKNNMMASETASATYTITDNAASVWIWGQELTSENPYYHNGVNGAQGTVDNIETDYNAYFNAAAGTLTLNGLDVRNSMATKTNTIEDETTTFAYGIFAEGDLDINVTADSAVSTGASAAGNANVAVGVKGDVTFTGSARLTATAGTGESTVGVYTLGNLEVSSGTLSGSTGAAGDAATLEDAESFGVSAMTLTVSGGELIGVGNTATGTDSCISAGIGAGNVTVTDGKITATGGKATAAYALSYGLYVTSLNIQDGETCAYGGAATGGNNGGFSAGVNVYDITVSGGSLTALGDHATATDGAYSQSCGIYAETDLINFYGGTVTATGDEAGDESCGIMNAGNYDNARQYINGGAIAVSGTADVTATGGDADFSYGLTAYNGITVTGGTIEGISNGIATAGNYGVSVPKDHVTVSGGSMTGTAAGGGNFSYGLFVNSGSVTVSGGSMTATADTSNNYSHGVCVSGSISVTGGTLTARSGSAANASALNRELTYNPEDIVAKGRNSSNTIIPVNYVAMITQPISGF